MKEEIGEGRWLVMMLIEPDTYIRQSLDEIIVGDTRFRRLHRLVPHAKQTSGRADPLLYRAKGITSATGIAKALNERGVPTTRGGQWQAVQVQRMLRSGSG